ncbi:MAG: hypothetical protein ACLGQH_02740 [Acidobacteriota bacterium]
MNKHILYESSYYKLIHIPSDGDSADLVTFQSWRKTSHPNHVSDFPPGFGENIFSQLGFNEFHVIPSVNDWYSRDDIFDLLAVLKANLSRRVFTYGSSMGGYAAIKFSHLLNTSAFIAFSPQHSINPVKINGDSRWNFEHSLLPKDNAERITLSDPILQKQHGYIFYSADNSDKIHAEMIAHDTSATLIPLAIDSHPCTLTINAVFPLKEIISQIIRDSFSVSAFTNKIEEKKGLLFQYAAKDVRDRESFIEIMDQIVAGNVLIHSSDLPLFGVFLKKYQIEKTIAKEFIEFLLTKWPNSPGPLVQLANIAWITSLKDFSIELTKQLLKFDQNDYTTNFTLGVRLKENHQFHPAQKVFEKIILTYPQFPGGYIQLSHIFNYLGNIEQAIQKAQDAIAIKNDDPSFYIHLGNLLRKSGDLEGAKKAQESAIALDSSIPSPHIQLSHIFNQLGNIERAIQKAQDAIAIQHDNPLFYIHLGNLLRNKGDLTGAKEAQERALTLDQSHPSPHIQLSYIFNQLGNIEQAIQKAQDAIALKNDNPAFYLHLSTLLKKSGDLAGAKEAQEKAAACSS